MLKPEARSHKPEVRSQKSEARSQKPEVKAMTKCELQLAETTHDMCIDWPSGLLVWASLMWVKAASHGEDRGFESHLGYPFKNQNANWEP